MKIKLIIGALLLASLMAHSSDRPWHTFYYSNQHENPFQAIEYLSSRIEGDSDNLALDGEAHYRLIQLYHKVGKTELAKQVYQKLANRTEQLDSNARVWLLLSEINLLLAEVKAKEAKPLLDKVREQAQNNSKSVRATYSYLKGQQRSLSSLYEEAIVELNDALMLAEDIGDTHLQVGVLSQLVNIQYYMQQYHESLKTNHQMRALAEQYKDDFFKMFSYSNEMNIYYMLATQQAVEANSAENEEDEKAALELRQHYINQSNEFRKKILQNAESIGAFKPLLRAMIQLQNQHLREKDYQKAVDVAKDSVEVAGKYKSEYEMAVSYNNMSIAHRALEQYEEAIEALKKADKVYTKLEHKQSMLWALEDFSIIYELMGDYEKALEFYKRLYTDSMSLIKTTNSEKVLELQKIYESEKSQREIERLNQQNLLNAAELKNQRGMILFAVILVLLIGAGLFYMVSRNKIIAVKNHKLDVLNKKLKEQALRDPLTKLHNRRFIGEIQDKLASTVVRRKATENMAKNKIGLVLLDIDHFKRINDEHGHDIGDDVLIKVSNDLTNNLRNGDIAVRWGGEEFLIVLFDTNLDGVRQFCQRMLEVRNSTKIKSSDVEIPVTMSMGYALFPFSEQDQHWLSWDESVKLVDNLLYIAKESGRNQAVTICAQSKDVSPEMKLTMLQLDKQIDHERLKMHQLSLEFMRP